MVWNSCQVGTQNVLDLGYGIFRFRMLDLYLWRAPCKALYIDDTFSSSHHPMWQVLWPHPHRWRSEVRRSPSLTQTVSEGLGFYPRTVLLPRPFCPRVFPAASQFPLPRGRCHLFLLIDKAAETWHRLPAKPGPQLPAGGSIFLLVLHIIPFGLDRKE